jgi:hypothetical protein
MPILVWTIEFVHIEQVSALFAFLLGQVLLYKLWGYSTTLRGLISHHSTHTLHVQQLNECFLLRITKWRVLLTELSTVTALVSSFDAQKRCLLSVFIAANNKKLQA